jgi:F-type H+-transporting ATPase subunit a
MIKILTLILTWVKGKIEEPVDLSINDEEVNLSEKDVEIDLIQFDKNVDLSNLDVIDKIIKSLSNDSPLNQFEILDLLSLDTPILGNLHISITNLGLYLIIGAFFLLVLNLLSTNFNKLVSNNWSISMESLYATVHSIVTNQINSKKGQIYFPFIYTLFIFILINNLIGMVPYSFASTSHFVLTFSLSFTIVLGATLLGFQIQGLEFFSILVPAGCPIALLPLLVLIEFISYLARNISLGLRLAANILSGHMLLNILAGFTYNIMTNGLFFFFLGLIPLLFIIAFSGLELGIAFIQAQVFIVLSSSYIKDGLVAH